MTRLLLAALFCVATFAASAQTLPKPQPFPGGVVTVPVGKAERPPMVYFGAERVMVVRDRKEWVAVVGLAQQLTPGVHYLSVVDSEQQSRAIEITVNAKEYGEQRIRLKDQNMVEPSEPDLVRILQEVDAIRAMFTHWSDVAMPPLQFDLPAKGRVSGIFGTRRFFNDEERQPHAGLDLAAKRGTPALAPAEGTVVGTGEYFFNGKTIFIDHGQSLISMFNHLDRIDVTPGTVIKRGQQVGTIGDTGRATGPHLHWTVVMNNARVDPMLLLSAKARKQIGR